MSDVFFGRVAQCLACGDPARKLGLTRELFAALFGGTLEVDPAIPLQREVDAGRPARPPLVAPRELARRNPATPAGRVALLHAVAHIEFNAINLAWDAVYRFRGLPVAYYHDWARVAAEEAYHFRLLAGRLAGLGASYGELPAHDGLWQAARDTAHDPLVRMALVPRVLEARGLDVSPGMIERLRALGDDETVALLRVILADEVGHVRVGTRWFRYLCARRGLEPDETFGALLREYMPGVVRPPFHVAARRDAGFSRRELDELEALAAGLSDSR
ncbi:MAG TPA: ferritin-like domain-containing protein [Gammaproteobacteria bacterium]|nr:ferritin-like domain-containing protein [Gammaproteobacteria bacterium]